LIDIITLELSWQFFALNYTFYTNEFCFDELGYEQEHLSIFIERGVLIVEPVDDHMLNALGKVQTQRAVLSDADCAAFVQAQNKKANLLTSDAALRKWANRNAVETHGHLWVFDEMVKAGTIHPYEAAAKLKTLLRINPRLGLPKAECEKRFKEWG